jgi:DNA-binding NtrC family response regulator
MELSTHRTAERDHAAALLAVQDEDVASPSSVRLLITGATQQGVETLARRVHETGPRARFPFVHRCAGDLPVGAEMLREYWASFRVAAAGGSVLI